MIKRALMGLLAFGLAAASIVAVARPDRPGPTQPTEPIFESSAIAAALDLDTSPSVDSGTVVGTAGTVVGVEPLDVSDPEELLVSASADRSDPVALDGAALNGVVYIYAASNSVEKVTFWLDHPKMKGKPHQTQKEAPFDFAGGTDQAAKPFDTSILEDGNHTIAARVVMDDGSQKKYLATFSVGSDGVVVDGPPAKDQAMLLVSDHARRGSPDSLDGSRLAGDAYIFLDLADESAQKVSFWLDRTSGNPDNIEKQEPFDLIGGTGKGYAKPLETAELADGSHSLKAMATLEDGSTVVTTATFHVSNGETTGTGSPATTTGKTPTTSGKTPTTSGKSGTTTTTTTGSKSAPTTSAPKTTTTTRSSSQTTISVSGDVRFKPGDNVESIVNSAPKGTVFVFSAGTYKGLSIKPNTSQTFVGESGAVLDGNGAKYAFRSGKPGVTIQGLEITDYKPSSKEAVVGAEPGAKNWTLVNNEIHHNGEIGVGATTGWTLSGNNIHHNGRFGITGAGSGILVSGNEIAYNSTTYGATGDSGGTKFVKTSGLVLRSNYVHHNQGNGLWADIDNVNPLIESNTLVSNLRAGAFIEMSCGGTIRNNTVKENGHQNPFPNWMGDSSGIMVTDSPNVQIYGNTLSGNEKGIGAVQDDRTGISNCDPKLKNLKVHDNVITQSGGAAAGIDAAAFAGNVFSSWGNSFSGNTYKLSGGAQFRWQGDWISYDQWKAKGLS